MKSKLITATILGFSLLTLGAGLVMADSGCTDQYGASVICPSSQLFVNKKVMYPTNSNLFVENLTNADDAYAPSDTIEYDVAVTNKSSVNFQTVTVIDVFPGQVSYVSGPGVYNASGHKLTYELSNLSAGQTVHNRIVVKAKDVSVNSKDTCEVVNTVTATGPDGRSGQDTSTLCIKLTPPKTLPVAGFEDYAYMLPFAVLAIIGFGILGKGYIRP